MATGQVEQLPEESTMETDLIPQPRKKKHLGCWEVTVVCCNIVVTLFCLGLNFGLGKLIINLGAFFNEYHLHEETMDIKWVVYVNILMVGLTAPLASWAISGKHEYRIRITAAIGALLSTLGIFVSAFAWSAEVLCVTYGVIAGIGFGLALTPALGIISIYFPKQRYTFANAVAFTGSSIGIFVFPPLISAAAERYGKRPTFIILACLNFQMVVATVLFPGVDPPKLTALTMKEKLLRFKRDLFCKIPLMGTMAAAMFFVGAGFNVLLLHLQSFVNRNGTAECQFVSVSEPSELALRVCAVFMLIGQILHGALSLKKRFDDGEDTTYRLFMFGVSTLLTGIVALFSSIAESCAGNVAVAALVGLGGGIYLPLTFGLARHATAASDGWTLTDELGVGFPMYSLGAFIGLAVGDVANDALENYNTSFFLAGGALVVVSTMTTLRCLFKLRALCRGQAAKVTPAPAVAESRPGPSSEPEGALQARPKPSGPQNVTVQVHYHNPTVVNVLNTQEGKITKDQLLQIASNPEADLRQRPIEYKESRPKAKRRALSMQY